MHPSCAVLLFGAAWTKSFPQTTVTMTCSKLDLLPRIRRWPRPTILVLSPGGGLLMDSSGISQVVFT